MTAGHPDDHATAATDPVGAVRAVRASIAKAARQVDRDPADVTLVAIGKTHPPRALAAVVAAGVTDLGENRVAELIAKLDTPRPSVAAPVVDARDGQPGQDDDVGWGAVRWHFVGQLQSRKARDLVGRDVLVHSVDRRSLVDQLDRRSGRAGVVQRILVQVNVGDDPAKGGCSLHELGELVAYAVARPNLEVQGLMTVPPMPPEDVDPADAARPHFAALRAARDRTVGDHPGVRELSMGMTADLAAAVAEGATMVRVGTALFGPRGDSAWTPRPSSAAETSRHRDQPS